MNEKERLLSALRHEETDRPPCICPGGMMNMITRDVMGEAGIFWPEAHSDAGMMAELSAMSHDLGCFENYGVPFCMTVEAESMGASVDLGDEIHEPRVTGYAAASVSEWRKIPPIDFAHGRAKVVLDAIRLLKSRNDNVPITGNITGPVSTASSLVDPLTFYRELRRKKNDAHSFMEFISGQLLRFGLEQIRAGADVIAVSDPSGTGEILGPSMFAEYAVPAINTITRGLHDEFPDAGIIVHICGQMHSVFKPLSEIFCGALSFDAEVGLKEAKNNLPGKSIMGNVSTFAIDMSTPERVGHMAKFCAECGADIVAPACGMGTCSPLANVKAILEAVKNA